MEKQPVWSRETMEFWSRCPKEGPYNRYLMQRHPEQYQEVLRRRYTPEGKGKYRAYETEYINSDSEGSIAVFLKHMHSFSDKSYWKYLERAYTRQDKSPVPVEVSRYLFGADRRFRNMLMDGQERAVLNTLPEKLKIYRAMSIEEYKSGIYGVSWTLDKKVAQFFWHRKFWDEKKLVVEKVIRKEEVIALFLGRKESEIIYINSPE